MSEETLVEGPAGGSARGLEALLTFLSEQGVECQVVPHETTYRASDEARASEVPPDHAAKTVILMDREHRARLAIVPASERVDMHKVRELVGATRGDLRLATESEMRKAFPAYEVGAVPPLGPHTVPEIVDRRLLDHARILCSGGDHRHSVLIAPTDVVRISGAQVDDICSS